VVLKLLDNPENFLSSVQVGITLIGIVSGAYGGAMLTDDLERVLSQFNFLEPHHHTLALITVIGSITYFSIVIGELVPKTIAMNNSERIALFSVPIIRYFTMLTYPFVWLLSFSTSMILKVFGVQANASEKVSEDELRFMLKSAGKQGVLEKEETEVHHNLFSFTDQTAKSLMTHVSMVEWIDLRDSLEAINAQLKESGHSKFIVGDGSQDNIIGVIHIKSFLENYKQKDFKLQDIMLEPIVIFENTPAFRILNIFKSKKQYIAIVMDEFGSTKGVVTLHDLTEAIVGDLPEADESDELYIVRRDDGSFLIDGRTLIYELNQYFQQEIIEDNLSTYTTISGFILYKMESMPKVGQKLYHENIVIEIMDLDGNRIDKVLLSWLS
jgi:putative hemolysin